MPSQTAYTAYKEEVHNVRAENLLHSFNQTVKLFILNNTRSGAQYKRI